ncbi:MAG: DUF5320 family protein [Candidatus Nanoarchaeia archaeon]|nr:DUF5320 family protein [Candidatus Nanoarchaeia archaeon]
MPGGDGTGPRGRGPGTGWGYGPCGAGTRGGGRRFFGFGRGYFDEEGNNADDSPSPLQITLEKLQLG